MVAAGGGANPQRPIGGGRKALHVIKTWKPRGEIFKVSALAEAFSDSDVSSYASDSVQSVNSHGREAIHGLHAAEFGKFGNLSKMSQEPFGRIPGKRTPRSKSPIAPKSPRPNARRESLTEESSIMRTSLGRPLLNLHDPLGVHGDLADSCLQNSQLRRGIREKIAEVNRCVRKLAALAYGTGKQPNADTTKKDSCETLQIVDRLKKQAKMMNWPDMGYQLRVWSQWTETVEQRTKEFLRHFGNSDDEQNELVETGCDVAQETLASRDVIMLTQLQQFHALMSQTYEKTVQKADPASPQVGKDGSIAAETERMQRAIAINMILGKESAKRQNSLKQAQSRLMAKVGTNNIDDGMMGFRSSRRGSKKTETKKVLSSNNATEDERYAHLQDIIRKHTHKLYEYKQSGDRLERRILSLEEELVDKMGVLEDMTAAAALAAMEEASPEFTAVEPGRQPDNEPPAPVQRRREATNISEAPDDRADDLMQAPGPMNVSPSVSMNAKQKKKHKTKGKTATPSLKTTKADGSPLDGIAISSSPGVISRKLDFGDVSVLAGAICTDANNKHKKRIEEFAHVQTRDVETYGRLSKIASMVDVLVFLRKIERRSRQDDAQNVASDNLDTKENLSPTEHLSPTAEPTTVADEKTASTEPAASNEHNKEAIRSEAQDGTIALKHKSKKEPYSKLTVETGSSKALQKKEVDKKNLDKMEPASSELPVARKRQATVSDAAVASNTDGPLTPGTQTTPGRRRLMMARQQTQHYQEQQQQELLQQQKQQEQQEQLQRLQGQQQLGQQHKKLQQQQGQQQMNHHQQTSSHQQQPETGKQTANDKSQRTTRVAAEPSESIRHSDAVGRKFMTDESGVDDDQQSDDDIEEDATKVRRDKKALVEMYALLSSAQRRNKQLQKRRDAKFLVLQRVMERRGFTNPVFDRKPELAEEKKTRLKGSIAEYQANLNTLTKMREFWEHRISQRAERVKCEKQMLADQYGVNWEEMLDGDGSSDSLSSSGSQQGLKKRCSTLRLEVQRTRSTLVRHETVWQGLLAAKFSTPGSCIQKISQRGSISANPFDKATNFFMSNIGSGEGDSLREVASPLNGKEKNILGLRSSLIERRRGPSKVAKLKAHKKWKLPNRGNLPYPFQTAKRKSTSARRVTATVERHREALLKKVGEAVTVISFGMDDLGAKPPNERRLSIVRLEADQGEAQAEKGTNARRSSFSLKFLGQKLTVGRLSEWTQNGAEHDAEQPNIEESGKHSPSRKGSKTESRRDGKIESRRGSKRGSSKRVSDINSGTDEWLALESNFVSQAVATQERSERTTLAIRGRVQSRQKNESSEHLLRARKRKKRNLGMFTHVKGFMMDMATNDEFKDVQNSFESAANTVAAMLEDENVELESVREICDKLLDKFGGPLEAAKSLAAFGTGQKLTRGKLALSLVEVGYNTEESERFFQYALRVSGLNTSVTRQIGWQDLLSLFRFMSPIHTMAEFRNRLIQKFGKVPTAIDTVDVNGNKTLELAEFAQLASSVGAKSGVARALFCQVLEEHADNFVGNVPAEEIVVRVDDFIFSCKYAEALCIFRNLRARANVNARTVYQVFPEIDNKSFGRPLKCEEFSDAIAPVDVSRKDANELYRFFVSLQANGSKMFQGVLMAECVIRAWVGFGLMYASVCHQFGMQHLVNIHADQATSQAEIAINGPGYPRRAKDEYAKVDQQPSKVRNSVALTKLAFHQKFRTLSAGLAFFGRVDVHVQRKLADLKLLCAKCLPFPTLSMNNSVDAAAQNGKSTMSIAEFVRTVRRNRRIKTLAHLRAIIHMQAEDVPAMLADLDPLGSGHVDLHTWACWLAGRGVPANEAYELFGLLKKWPDAVAIPTETVVDELWHKRNKIGFLSAMWVRRLLSLWKAVDKQPKLLNKLQATSPRLSKNSLTPGEVFRSCCMAGLKPSHAWTYILLCSSWDNDGFKMKNETLKWVLNKVRNQQWDELSIAFLDPDAFKRGFAPNHLVAAAATDGSSVPPVPLGTLASSDSLESISTSAGTPSPSETPVQKTGATKVRVSKVRIEDCYNRNDEENEPHPPTANTKKSFAKEAKTKHSESGLLETETEKSNQVFEVLAEEKVVAIVESELKLASSRYVAFHGVLVDFQISMHCAHNFWKAVRSKVKIAKNTSQWAHEIWRWLCRDTTGGELPESIDFSTFQVVSAGAPTHLSMLDSQRVFKIFELVEGQRFQHFPHFLGVMRMLTPIYSVAGLRTRLVQRYSSVPMAVEALRKFVDTRASSVTSDGFSVDEFEVRLLCCAGVVDTSARWLFKILDPAKNGDVKWENLSWSLENADVFYALQSRRDAFLKTSKTLQVAFMKAKVMDDFGPAALISNLTKKHLSEMGFPARLFDTILDALDKAGDLLSDPTLNDLLKQMKAFDGHPEAVCNSSFTHSHTSKTSADVQQGTDAQWASSITVWRAFRTEMLNKYSGGLDEAFVLLGFTGGETKSVNEWRERLRKQDLEASKNVDELFGSIAGWQTAKGNARVSGNELARVSTLAAPITSLRMFRQRLLDDMGTLHKAFDRIANNEQSLSHDSWVRALRRLWIPASEAAQLYVFFPASADGAVSSPAFMRTLGSPDTVTKTHKAAFQLIRKHNLISKAFEKLPLTELLGHAEFESACQQLLGTPATVARAICAYIFEAPYGLKHGPSQVQLADLLETFNAIEERAWNSGQELDALEAVTQDVDDNARIVGQSKTKRTLRGSIISEVFNKARPPTLVIGDGKDPKDITKDPKDSPTTASKLEFQRRKSLKQLFQPPVATSEDGPAFEPSVVGRRPSLLPDISGISRKSAASSSTDQDIERFVDEDVNRQQRVQRWRTALAGFQRSPFRGQQQGLDDGGLQGVHLSGAAVGDFGDVVKASCSSHRTKSSEQLPSVSEKRNNMHEVLD